MVLRLVTLICIMTVFFSSTSKKRYADFCTKMLRTKLEPVHFGSEIWTCFFFKWKKKDSQYANEVMRAKPLRLHLSEEITQGKMYCQSHNNSFQRFLVLVYYWKTVWKPETDPQLLWEWQYSKSSVMARRGYCVIKSPLSKMYLLFT
jgi:hypothetical protein